MKLNIEELEKIRKTENIYVPNIDLKKLKIETKENPTWLHFGAGNIFRGYIGKIQQRLIEKGLEKTGIIVAENYDIEIIEKVYSPYDNLSIVTTLKKNGIFESEIIESIVQSIEVINKNMEILERIIKNENLQIVSFTITEKGYNLKTPEGEYLSSIKEDIKNGCEVPKHIMVLMVRLLYMRYKQNQKPLTLLSMDNCSNNGDKIKKALLEISKMYLEKNIVDEGFIDYLENKISYPLTMIDKITPRPSKIVEEYLKKIGFENISPIVTSKNSYIAPFINVEEAEYFVIEDNFLNGRPKFEKVGVYLTDRETVKKTERMKVTTCLNPLHTTLAIFGVLLNKKSISEAMDDRDLKKFIEKLAYTESLKVVENPKIIDPESFIKEVIEERFSNPYIPDKPERIATDTSQKIAIRFGETIKAYKNSTELDIKMLKYIPFVIAGWFRYLLGINDSGVEITLSKDPMLDYLKAKLKDIKYDDEKNYYGQLKEILKNDQIFGIDLVEIGLSDKIEKYFIEMIRGKNAVRRSLEKIL